jgi:hypothetical protein
MGKIVIPDLRSHSKWKLLTEVDWRTIHADSNIWPSIYKKYHKEREFDKEIAKKGKYGLSPNGNILFRSNITPEEALQICRLTKAGLAYVTINRTGQISTWRLNK